eukprot:scaffold301698_cov24-Prasinocladus_malaysianus.AAC.1
MATRPDGGGPFAILCKRLPYACHTFIRCDGSNNLFIAVVLVTVQTRLICNAEQVAAVVPTPRYVEANHTKYTSVSKVSRLKQVNAEGPYPQA